MENNIRFAVVNEENPKATVIVPDVDFVFAVVHAKGSDGNQVICQSNATIEVAAASLLSALEGVARVTKDDKKLQRLVLAGQLAQLEEKMGGDQEGGEEDE